MNLDVLIPSLLLPAPMQKLLPPSSAPALERLLARADRDFQASTSQSSWLFERWGAKAPYSIAAVTAEYDGLQATDNAWMFAEPVSLTPQGKWLKMFPARYLDLGAGETADLIGALNSHFADRKIQFFASAGDSAPQRWYVCCPAAEIPATTSPDAARMGSLAEFQPNSAGTLDWRSLQNEAQMLFFEHPVNTAREAVGKACISGVWFWGGGLLPDLKNRPYDRVVTSSLLATQLARKTSIDVHPLNFESIQSAQGNVLAVLESCADFARDFDLLAWGREVERLDREWFLPISQLLAKGSIKCLTLFVPDGERTRSYRLTRRNQLLRFWRTAKPLATHA